jgi:hypothetical protein
VILLPRNRQDLVALCGDKSPIPAFAMAQYRREPKQVLGYKEATKDVLWLYGVTETAQRATIAERRLREAMVDKVLPRPDLSWKKGYLFEQRHIDLIRDYAIAIRHAPHHSRGKSASITRAVSNAWKFWNLSDPFSHTSKLTHEKAEELRKRHWIDGETFAALAAEFGVHYETVYLACTYRSWRSDNGH